MPYVVTQSCCSDASCVVACPVNCIHPAPGEPGFLEAEMVYVDADACVDCGACTTACPVGAIKPHTMLEESELPFIALAESYYADFPHADRAPLAVVRHNERVESAREVRVAIVGAGPAAMYAADELLKSSGVTVDVFDRLSTPYGLVRAGVAPDHQRTKQVTKLFHAIEEQPGFGYYLNVEIGTHVTLDDLHAHYHAVIYATGAAHDRPLGIEGEEMAGSESATTVVGWYNGHPDHQDAYVDLSHERVVVIGNGNVALDVARILTADPAALALSDVPALPLAALRGSAVREVVVLGRRGPEHAAFTMPELIGLAGLPDVDLVVDNRGRPLEGDSPKLDLLREIAARPRRQGGRRIVLRFDTTPVRILGDGVVGGIEVTDSVAGETETIEAGMVLRSIGYRAVEIPGLPFDTETATVPNDGGRVEPGTYVTGWIKRGPRGFIGTNKSCAEETVAGLIDDVNAGRIAEPARSRAAFDLLVRRNRPELVDLAGWRAIDAAERAAGRARGSAREKFIDPQQVREAIASGAPAGRRRG